MSGILFVDDPVSFADSAKGAKAILDRPRSKEQIFDSLQQQLRFPDYFGHNWDALAECLRDFGWLSDRNVTIAHANVPLLRDQDLLTYVTLLEFCVDRWKATDEHTLTVVFPASATMQVHAVLTRAQRDSR